ncbi:hypothetical protein A1O3_00292 [Capronia epimyces CBS 606.96]|uniref:Peptidase S9 prolyl oligopeptidase catalytic domain-containing protein n=1 Tax=Capronia epimyces CBS 606.96 TaxID=1182542 RepID=W9YFS3_9EURO|nr:uncharacterized protein A1O3_00292 [Capronia epimyces CBS 606.96]EXJ91742.1 hypothetical protein A1O3_00292 [Capronia epimyces CBS 606.96]
MRLDYYANILLCVTLYPRSVAAGISQAVLSTDHALHPDPITFLSTWDLLGPFRLGTREAVWGADPVELYGGIRSVAIDEGALYHSPLTRDATVQWSNRTFTTLASKTRASVELVIDFPEVDWQFAQKIYGWSAFQFQGWAKGGIWNTDSVVRRVVLHPVNILELWVNDIHVFGGDFYGFERAPVALDLRPGLNDISVRLTRDVRSMGGAFPPVIRATLKAELVSASIEVPLQSLVLPDVVCGRFCSRFGSITVRNQGDSWIQIQHIFANLAERSAIVSSEAIGLAPGQSRPVKMTLESIEGLQEVVHFELEYTTDDSKLYQQTFQAPITHTNDSSSQKITFLHPSGVVSYAILRPPPTTNSPSVDQVAPVLLNLHGAGVEADGSLARHMFDAAQDLPVWILSPSGLSPWSGDDWHTWGMADAEAALSAVPKWIRDTGWDGPALESPKLLIAGHSNGAQGTWFYASHQPDRVLGAAAASGYSSIENYVPYLLWNEADPLQVGIIQTSMNSFRHELLTENLAGIPIFQQHGTEDANVPVYHSRLMNTLLAQVGQVADYSELPGRGHWFTGSMTTPSMLDFYHGCLNGSNPIPTVPTQFTFVVPNSHDLGSRYGIVIDQLATPDRMGRIKVTTSLHGSINRWHIRTENIRRLHFSPAAHLANAPDEIVLDDMPQGVNFANFTEKESFVKFETNIWGREVALEWRNIEQRYGRQRGFLDSILRSAGPFELVYCSDQAFQLAIQASRNFMQYFGADSNINPCLRYKEALHRQGNIITIGLGTTIPPASLPTFPIQLGEKQILLTTKDSNTISIPRTSGMGGVWLRPLPDSRLELVVWGHDEVGLRQASRLIPTLTGAGQPDFAILNNEARWKGHSGAIAMGFFDYNWRISAASFLP